MLDVYEKHSNRKLIATALSIVVVAGFVIFADHIKNNQVTGSASTQSSSPYSTTTNSDTAPTAGSTSSAPSATDTTPASPTTSASASSGYTDGTYSASSTYYVPHGSETIGVDLTLKDGVITEVSVQNSESDRESARYQEDFASVYKSYVVGKKISGLKLGIVSGASDTTQGFDNALRQIETKAQA